MKWGIPYLSPPLVDWGLWSGVTEGSPEVVDWGPMVWGDRGEPRGSNGVGGRWGPNINHKDEMVVRRKCFHARQIKWWSGWTGNWGVDR